MELEVKLDEDFLFYLGFTNTFLKRLTDPELYHKSRVWLYKLIGEPCEGIERKRCRNLYLAQLLICMQNGVFDKPFLQPPHDVDVTNAYEVFAPIPKTIEEPDWLNDSIYVVQDNLKEDASEKCGRTYMATRTLPHGQGAIAYIGVSLTNEEPMWLGQGLNSFDQHLGEKFEEYVPPVYEMEKILARRKDPCQREKVLTFYDVLLNKIADELDGKFTPEDETIEGLLVQLIHDLTEKKQYGQYENLEEGERRTELLLLLFDRVKIRRDKVAKREEILDEIENGVPQSIFDESLAEPQDKYQLPAAMWEQAIDMLPSKRKIDKLMEVYPVFLVMKFVQCLSKMKEDVATKMQRRHENICTQMKKELRKEGERKKKIAEEAEQAMNNALLVLNAVKEQNKKKLELEKRAKRGFTCDIQGEKMYAEMKAAVFDQQRIVQDEALRGKFLAQQINEVSNNTELMMHVNEDMIKKAQEANMKIMKNIKKLSHAVKAYEDRVNVIRDTINTMKRTGQEMAFFV